MPNHLAKKYCLALLSITFLFGGCRRPFDVTQVIDAGSVLRSTPATALTLKEEVEEGGIRLHPEKLVYKIKWLGITAGELVSEVKGIEELRGRKVYRIEVTVRTVGSCSTLYRIDNRYVSYLDVEHLYSLRHEVHRREGSYKKDSVTDFDHDAGKAYFKSETDGSSKVVRIPKGVQDTVTASYGARFLPLEEGKTFSIHVYKSEKVYELFLNIGAKRVMNVPGRGKKEAFHLVPFGRLNGDQVREGSASGYITTDEDRLPFLVVIKTPVFTRVTATLVPSLKQVPRAR
jgi:hypothetical protein